MKQIRWLSGCVLIKKIRKSLRLSVRKRWANNKEERSPSRLVCVLSLGRQTSAGTGSELNLVPPAWNMVGLVLFLKAQSSSSISRFGESVGEFLQVSAAVCCHLPLPSSDCFVGLPRGRGIYSQPSEKGVFWLARQRNTAFKTQLGRIVQMYVKWNLFSFSN